MCVMCAQMGSCELCCVEDLLAFCRILQTCHLKTAQKCCTFKVKCFCVGVITVPGGASLSSYSYTMKLISYSMMCFK